MREKKGRKEIQRREEKEEKYDKCEKTIGLLIGFHPVYQHSFGGNDTLKALRPFSLYF